MTASGADMTGGVNAVYSGVDVLNETYTVDPWGNQQESGNFNFQQSYNPANNQINGYSYDAAGDLLGDGMNTYTYDGEGMLTSAGGAQYVYDALQQRVEKTGGGNSTEYIYFNGKPLALYNPANGAWTDLIWAGSNLLAKVAGNQTAVPVYRLLDHEGSLVATTDNSGNVTGTNLLTPYGQLLTSSTNDPYLYAGLYQDTEYGGDEAWYRNYSTEQSRWLTPDPYNGSYDLMNPQSFNRYSYVENHPLTFTDPSGLANGWLTGIGGSICNNLNGTIGNSSFNNLIIPTPIGNINPCDPAASLIAIGIQGTFNGIWGTAIQAGEIAPFVAAAITVACSIDNFNDAACGGSSGWASVAFGNGSVASKVVGDTNAVIGAALCATGGPTSPGCIGYAIYTIANDLFSVFWDLFGPPQFTGSLLPRPSDLGGLGTSPIGIPNQNLGIKGILGQPSRGTVQSPGMNIP